MLLSIGEPAVSDGVQGKPLRLARPLSVSSMTNSENEQDDTSSAPTSPGMLTPSPHSHALEEVQSVYSIINEEARLTETSDTESSEAMFSLAFPEGHSEELNSEFESQSLPEDKMTDARLTVKEKEGGVMDTEPLSATVDTSDSSRANCPSPEVKSAAQRLMDEYVSEAKQKAAKLKEKSKSKLLLIVSALDVLFLNTRELYMYL